MSPKKKVDNVIKAWAWQNKFDKGLGISRDSYYIFSMKPTLKLDNWKVIKVEIRILSGKRGRRRRPKGFILKHMIDKHLKCLSRQRI